LSGGKGLRPYFYQVNEGSNYHKAFFIFPHKTMNCRNSWRHELIFISLSVYIDAIKRSNIYSVKAYLP